MFESLYQFILIMIVQKIQLNKIQFNVDLKIYKSERRKRVNYIHVKEKMNLNYLIQNICN